MTVFIKTASSKIETTALARSHQDTFENKTITLDELTTLNAIIRYVSSLSGRAEFGIERSVADRFAVANVKCLSSNHFNDAVHFMMKQVPPAAR